MLNQQPGQRADCAVRVISAMLSISYDDAFTMLRNAGRKSSRGTPLSVASKALRGKARRVTLRRRCTIERFVREHGDGSYGIATRHHMLAVVNGQVIDNRSTPMKSLVKVYWARPTA